MINDALTYYSASDFRSTEAAGIYRQLVTDRQRLKELNRELATSRNLYAMSDAAAKARLKDQILRAENEVLSLGYRIRQLEKQARNTEINVINK